MHISDLKKVKLGCLQVEGMVTLTVRPAWAPTAA